MNKEQSQYHPETYWDKVAKRIKDRTKGNVIAGDDEPYYRYKRKRFLKLLKSFNYSGKSVLEVGSGPGGNLLEILNTFEPKEVTGVDISETMVKLASTNLKSFNVNILKVDGNFLPFEDNSFDVVFTATVLQHNTNESMLRSNIGEICRISNGEVLIFERIENEILGDDLCLGRPVDYYKQIFEENGYSLNEVKFINVRVSYLVSGSIRKLFNSSKREEGMPITGFSKFLQIITLPLTRILDNVLKSRTDIAMLEFVRK